MQFWAQKTNLERDARRAADLDCERRPVRQRGLIESFVGKQVKKLGHLHRRTRWPRRGVVLRGGAGGQREDHGEGRDQPRGPACSPCHRRSPLDVRAGLWSAERPPRRAPRAWVVPDAMLFPPSYVPGFTPSAGARVRCIPSGLARITATDRRMRAPLDLDRDRRRLGSHYESQRTRPLLSSLFASNS